MSRLGITDDPRVLRALQGMRGKKGTADTAANGTTLGHSTLNEHGSIVIDVSTPWGIHNGIPYHDPGFITPGEEAIMDVNTDGQVGWRLVSEIY